jgi:catechol 2,3-dioxygenase-like lactoylglutathione lyase family enzyme
MARTCLAIDAALRKFHASFNVSDLPRSIAFYRALLGVEPAKVRADYAKFDLAEPPLVLSLIPGRPSGMGHLNHAGLRVRTADELVEIQRRLEAAGMPTQREEGVECCYARQTKFWINDPDGALWEIYVFHEDIAQHGFGASPKDRTLTVMEPAEETAQSRIASHRLGEPLPVRFAEDDATVAEVQLQGSLHAEATAEDRQTLLDRAYQALQPEGVLRVRGLAGDRECPSVTLPGPAAGVRYVPTAAAIVEGLRTAGFVDVRIETLGEHPCFQADGVSLREIRLVASKPGARRETAASCCAEPASTAPRSI